MKGGLEVTDFEETCDAAPGPIQPVVLMGSEGRTLENMRWGFKFPDRLLFNTRSEATPASTFWKEKLAERRCIVPATSFFEWQGEKGSKTKYEVIVPQRRYFGMAGVWTPWKNPKTEMWEDTFSIFTSDPNGVMVKIHDRQPVILEPRDYEEWLEPSERPPIHLLRVFPDEKMKMMPVEGDAMHIINQQVSLFHNQ